MIVIKQTESITYAAESGDWRLVVSNGHFEILPQVGGLTYESAINIENLAKLIMNAKQHAINNGINWE